MLESVQKSTILEHRNELMVSPTGSLPVFREARFLKPTVTAIDRPSLKLPSLSLKPRWPLEVSFNGWNNPLRKWKTWVHRMHSRYSSVWKEAGIYEALMGSTHKIIRDNDLIFGITERWCADTNTFIFPWGECTVTLEDILILGGFSVLGCSVQLPLENENLIEIKDGLEQNSTYLERLKCDSHSNWINLFMSNDSLVEHEAFLALWLSMFVFPGDGVGLHVFPIAIHLSRGRRLALGPAVLAGIYRDLGLLKEAMVASTELNDQNYFLSLTLWSRLDFVQVWVWERLSSLGPKPNPIEPYMVRMARWDRRKGSEIGNPRPAIDSAGVNFLWRPYAISVGNRSFPIFYKEKEVLVNGENLSGDMESFVRCLRVCQLIGIDCQEPYNPHRVALQFGYDQDLPGWIPREHLISEIAWFNYSKPLSGDEIVYFPARLHEADVSARYLEWWRKTVLCPTNAIKGLVKKRRSSKKRVKITGDWEILKLGNGLFLQNLIPLKAAKPKCPDIPPVFSANAVESRTKPLKNRDKNENFIPRNDVNVKSNGKKRKFVGTKQKFKSLNSFCAKAGSLPILNIRTITAAEYMREYYSGLK